MITHKKISDEQMDSMFVKAVKKYGKIKVCGDSSSHYDNFTVHNDEVTFWFNEENNSTHIMVEKIDEQNNRKGEH